MKVSQKYVHACILHVLKKPRMLIHTHIHIQDKLTSMMGLKSDIAALSSKTESELQKVAKSIDDVKSGGDATQKSTDSKLDALKNQLDGHIADQKTEFGKTTGDVTSMSKDVHELEAFQTDASTLQRKLVKDLTDVTQSLGILDTKFSGQNVDVKTRVAALENAGTYLRANICGSWVYVCLCLCVGVRQALLCLRTMCVCVCTQSTCSHAHWWESVFFACGRREMRVAAFESARMNALCLCMRLRMSLCMSMYVSMSSPK
jgi:hypothetical protein